jgi:hypothetical protein
LIIHNKFLTNYIESMKDLFQNVTNQVSYLIHV